MFAVQLGGALTDGLAGGSGRWDQDARYEADIDSAPIQLAGRFGTEETDTEDRHADLLRHPSAEPVTEACRVFGCVDGEYTPADSGRGCDRVTRVGARGNDDQ